MKNLLRRRVVLTALTLFLLAPAAFAQAVNTNGWWADNLTIGGNTIDLSAFTPKTNSADGILDLGELSDTVLTAYDVNIWAATQDRGGMNVFFRVRDGLNGSIITEMPNMTNGLWIALTHMGGNDYHAAASGLSTELFANPELLVPGTTYYLEMWAKTYGDSGDQWYSADENYFATFSVANTTDPVIICTGDRTLAMDGDPVTFNLTFSLNNATATAWEGSLTDGATSITNWSSSAATLPFTWTTDTIGTWQLTARAFDGSDLITNRTFTLSVTENLGGLGTVWHCPTNHEPHAEYAMRIPNTPSEGWNMQIRVGNYQPNGTMTSGLLWFTVNDGTAWLSASFAKETNILDAPAGNDYWLASVPIPAGSAGGVFAYYMEIHYENDADLSTTYVYMDPDDSVMYKLSKSSATAEASPFEVGIRGNAGTEPGFVLHSGNIIRGGSDTNVQIWAKTGYINGPAGQWTDEAVIRYRIDVDTAGTYSRGVTREVVRKTKGATARSWNALPNQVAMTLQSTENNANEHGNTMVWMGSISDAALANPNAVLRYEIYARKKTENGGTGNWRQAEYGAFESGSCTFIYRMWSDGSGDLTVNGTPADYTTSKWFIDEADPNDKATFIINYHAPDDATEVELFTNLGRRDFADVDTNGDGWPDALIPPNGNDVTPANSANGYWQAIPMTKGAGAWTKTLEVNKCGVYRITARYKAAGASEWTWYSADPAGGANRRDHVAVISPKKALAQTMYELNVLTTKATNYTTEGAGSFETLAEVLGNGGDFDEFSVPYLNKMGINCLWFQPIHPNGSERVETVGGNRYWPGSPYATKNYFAVTPEASTQKDSAAAMAAFTNYVRLCDKARRDVDGKLALETINIMLDGVMNHTSWDAVYGEGLALATNGLGDDALTELDDAYLGWRNLTATNRIAQTGQMGINWYSRNEDYSKPATFYNSASDNNVAVAPERWDFGKWDDVAELLYGWYSTMIRTDDRIPVSTNEYGDVHYELGEETGRIYNEEDWYDYSTMLPATKLLWKYMAAYPEFWLKKTGHSGVNQPGVRDANGILLDDYGIDGLRCDYAQGLPSQFWEYVINRTRSFKWNFLFMAESLDGGTVGYRSNRQFDILNENIVFRFTQDKLRDPDSFQYALEDRRNTYGDGIILLNLTSHDEIIPYGDPWVTASRYAMVATVDGIPMIFYGQEHGISPYVATGTESGNTVAADKWKGFSWFESNFGKWVPHFKMWNKLRVWEEPPYPAATDLRNSRNLAAFYSRINHARLSSPALQSKNRWFLKYLGTNPYNPGDVNRILAVAKWTDSAENPNLQDAVLAFVLFLNGDDNDGVIELGGAAATYNLAPMAAQLGIQNRTDRFYNVRNLAARDPNAYLWADPLPGSEVITNFYVGFAGIDTNDAAVGFSDGAIVQYLKIEDVTDYPPPVFDPVSVPTNKTIGEEVSFTVTATGDGFPEVSVTSVVPPHEYAYANDQLAFTPTLATNFTFSFLAQNRYNAASATTNITVGIIGGTVAGDPVVIQAIDSMVVTPGIGGIAQLALTLTCADLPAGATVPVYSATELTGNNWNWRETGTATISGNTVTFSIPIENVLLISIGKPDYLAE